MTKPRKSKNSKGDNVEAFGLLEFTDKIRCTYCCHRYMTFEDVYCCCGRILVYANKDPVLKDQTAALRQNSIKIVPSDEHQERGKAKKLLEIPSEKDTHLVWTDGRILTYTEHPNSKLVGKNHTYHATKDERERYNQMRTLEKANGWTEVKKAKVHIILISAQLFKRCTKSQLQIHPYTAFQYITSSSSERGSHGGVIIIGQWVAAIDFKKPSTQWSTAACGGPRGNKASRNHTYSDSQSCTTSNERQRTLTLKSKHFHFERGTEQSDQLSTLLFKSLMKPKKWKRCDHGVRLSEHDPNTILSNPNFEDDILLISGSLKDTTTMLDDFTTATTAHGLQLHPTKTQIIPIRHQSAEEATRWQFKVSTSRSFRQQGKQIPWSTHHLQKTQSQPILNAASNARGQHSRATGRS